MDTLFSRGQANMAELLPTHGDGQLFNKAVAT